jgi:uncharacterized protein with ParB-like and HNH nuclease domain
VKEMSDQDQSEFEVPLEGDTSDDEEITPVVSYDVSSYGADPEVEVLVNRIQRGDIIIPPFQRDYVWRHPEASKFIESLLLGLPVPGIFLATDPLTNKQLVIDGQQRLKTLQFFFEGFFNPKKTDSTKKVFTLVKVQRQFEGKTFNTLEELDRIRLQTSIIHATIVKQNSPLDNDTSLFHIFERLNSGGRRLSEQEMRLALYHGSLIELLKNLNKFEGWRDVFGKLHPRLKDQELILRFFAFLEDRNKYGRPMGEFLNIYAARNRNLDSEKLSRLSIIFRETIDAFNRAINGKPFRISATLNVAVFDSCMVGLATRILEAGSVSESKVNAAYKRLINDKNFQGWVSRSTADEANVRGRIDLAVKTFSGC